MDRSTEGGKKALFIGLLHSFAERSSAVGPGHIKQTPTYAGKVLWAMALVAAIAITAYQTVGKIQQYYQFEAQTQVEIVFKRELPFPAVTVCNINPYRARVANVEAKALVKIMSKYTNVSELIQEPPVATSGTASTPTGKPLAPSFVVDSQQRQAWEQRMAAEKDSNSYQKQAVESMLEEISHMDEAVKADMGHALETMLLSCSFNGQTCSPLDFHRFSNWRYGNCYTFNSAWNGSSLQNSRNPGSDYGLSLALFLQTNEYMLALTETVGLKVILHDQNEIPFPEDEGLIVSAGAHTQIIAQRLEVERAPLPVRPGCQDADTTVDGVTNYYTSVVPGLRYQEKTCWRSCLQEEIVRRCSCESGYYPGPGVRTCQRSIPAEANCTDAVQLQYRNGELQCNCLPACNEISYRATPSNALWPTGNAWDLIKAKLEVYFPYLKDKNMTVGWARDNFAKVEVFYPALNFEKVTQSQAYYELDLLSDIGGVLGFWIGLSVASLLELVEFAILLFAALFSSGHKVTAVKKVKDEEK